MRPLSALSPVLLAGLAFVLKGAVAAPAQERASSLALSCAQVADLVRSRGAALLSTGPLTYDRYVRDQGACASNQFLEATTVPTRDDPRCAAVARCVENGTHGM